MSEERNIFEIDFEGRKCFLRDAGVGDEKMIDRFFDAMGGESRALFNRGDYNKKGLLKFVAKGDDSRRYWLMVDGEEMLGYVFFLDWDTLVPTLGVAVRDDLHGRGIGRALVGFAVTKAENEGKGGVMLTTHTANLRGQVLYESIGFRCQGLTKNSTELLYLLRFKDRSLKNN